MTASRSAVDAKLVLNRDYLDVVDVKVVCRAAIGIEFFFVDLKTYSIRIIVTFGAIINCSDDAPTIRKFSGNGLAEVSGESRDATLTRNMIADEGYVFDGGGSFHGLPLRSAFTFLPSRDESL